MQDYWFQSSPNPKVGCICNSMGIASMPRCFNPHPTRRLGASKRGCCKKAHNIGFNPHPTRRLGASGQNGDKMPGWWGVSILTQPEGWVHLMDIFGTQLRSAFQSSPNPKVGCIVRVYVVKYTAWRFQSSPNPKVGCIFHFSSRSVHR